MTIATILQVPKTAGEWAIFSFAHARIHQQIRNGLTALGFATGDYVLDPINPGAIPEWQGRVQQAHTEMNGALGLQSNSLEGADFNDPSQTAAWIFLNWQEDNAALEALKL
jgi:hypothetical protein